jgi:hypothetical protein
MLNVREAMAAFLVNQGWTPEGAELMSWAVHPFERSSPPSTRALQKQVKRRADAVGQRAQELEEPQAVQLAVNALASYRQSALDDGNEPLARVWADLLPAGAIPSAATAPAPARVTGAPDPGPTRAPAAPTNGWLHAVTLPPGRLAQLGSLDQPLDAVGRVAAQVLTAHLVDLGVDDHSALCERAALAGYLVDLDLAGVAPGDLVDPATDGAGLGMSSVLDVLAVLEATDLPALARHHSPAADAVLTRLLSSGPSGTDADTDLVAGCLGAGLCLARVQRGGA